MKRQSEKQIMVYYFIDQILIAEKDRKKKEHMKMKMNSTFIVDKFMLIYL